MRNERRVASASVAVSVMLSGCAAPMQATAPPGALPSPQAEISSHPPVLKVADFNLEGWRTNLDTAFGGWDNDPGDPTHDCRVRLVDDPRVGDAGFSVQLDYDVESPNPAFNGLWVKVPNVSRAAYKNLSFALKGDAEKGFTRRFKIELKDTRSSASFIFSQAEPEWVRYHIPLHLFEGIEKVKNIKEIVIIFEQETVTEPAGVLYLDDIYFGS